MTPTPSPIRLGPFSLAADLTDANLHGGQLAHQPPAADADALARSGGRVGVTGKEGIDLTLSGRELLCDKCNGLAAVVAIACWCRPTKSNRQPQRLPLSSWL
jgi:hypothetical protein